ncbi:MAG: diguanylate cyclase [Clostridiales bacterium]|nr:diguanylate cyclase [Clostridiales bacterium]
MKAKTGYITLLYTSNEVVYCNADNEDIYIDILKKAGAMNMDISDPIYIEDYEDYSISVDQIKLGDKHYNIAHISHKCPKEDYYKKLAYRDSLTGLYNRNLWEDIRSGVVTIAECSEYTIIILDMDNLKLINSQKGHGGGDEAIISIADIIRSCIRDADMAFRIGGDEFLILIPNMHEDKLIRDIIYRIQGKLRNVDIFDDIKISVSAGYAIGKATEDLDTTANIADLRMLERKRRKNGLLTTLETSALKIIGEHIEELRSRLNKLVVESLGKELSSKHVLKISQELDSLIGIYLEIIKEENIEAPGMDVAII